MVTTLVEQGGDERVGSSPPLPPAQPAPDPVHPFLFDWSLDNGFGSSESGSEDGPVPLPAEIGEEHMSAWEMGPGFGLFDHGFKLKQRLNVTGTKVVEQGVLVLRTGLTNASLCRRDGAETFTESVGQYSLHLFCRPGDTCTFTYDPGEPAFGLSPIITEDRLRSMLEGRKIPARIARFIDGRGEDFVASPRSSLNLSRIAYEVRNNPYQGGMSDLFIQGKVHEMLAEALSNLGDAEESAGRLLSRDQRLAVVARDLLMANPLNPPSMDILAQQVGLSQRRLIEAFRQTHGMTVAEWLVDWRMKHACILLREGALPIKEISFRLGYSHANHFITAFTRRFGEPPAKFRRSVISSHALGGIFS